MLGKKSTKDLVKPHGQRAAVLEDTAAQTAQAKPQKEKPAKEKKPPSERRPLKELLKSKGFIGAVCIVLALLLAFVAVPLMQTQLAKLAPVVVLTCDVPIASQITEEMLTYREMGTVGLPIGTLYDTEAAVGAYLTVAGAEGDVLTAARLSAVRPGDDPELAVLPTGKMAMSITLSDLAQSVSGKLRAGDVIQLFAVGKDATAAEGGKEYSALRVPELQWVEVLAVTNGNARDVTTGREAGSDTDTERQIATVTIAVDERQAATLAGLEHLATLHAALVCRGDPEAKIAALERQTQYFEAEKELVAPPVSPVPGDVEPPEKPETGGEKE